MGSLLAFIGLIHLISAAQYSGQSITSRIVCTDSVITISSCFFSNITSSSGGGAVYFSVSSGVCQCSSSLFYWCTSSGAGGAILGYCLSGSVSYSCFYRCEESSSSGNDASGANFQNSGNASIVHSTAHLCPGFDRTACWFDCFLLLAPLCISQYLNCSGNYFQSGCGFRHYQSTSGSSYSSFCTVSDSQGQYSLGIQGCTVSQTFTNFISVRNNITICEIFSYQSTFQLSSCYFLNKNTALCQYGIAVLTNCVFADGSISYTVVSLTQTGCIFNAESPLTPSFAYLHTWGCTGSLSYAFTSKLSNPSWMQLSLVVSILMCQN